MGDGGSVMKKNWKKKMQKGGYFFLGGVWNTSVMGGGRKRICKKKENVDKLRKRKCR